MARRTEAGARAARYAERGSGGAATAEDQPAAAGRSRGLAGAPLVARRAAGRRPRWEILGDPAHKRPTPLLHHVDETLECWKLIAAPLLWVEGDRTDIGRWWGRRYTKDEFHQRLSVVPNVERQVLAPAGHMLHHDQPEALAARLEAFLAH